MVPGTPLRAVIWCRAHPPWGLGPRCRYGPHRPQPSQQYCQTLSTTRNVHLFRCVTQGFRKTSLAIASALFTQQWPHPAPPVLLERSSVKLPRSTRVRKLPRRCSLHLRANHYFRNSCLSALNGLSGIREAVTIWTSVKEAITRALTSLACSRALRVHDIISSFSSHYSYQW